MKATFNAETTLKESPSLLSWIEAAGSASPAGAPASPVTSPGQAAVEPTGSGGSPDPTPTPETFLSDGTYIWRWGAWRDPVTDKAWEPQAPVYEAPGQAYAASTPGGCPSLIIEVFGPTAGAACRVAQCESGFDWNATGAAGERGIFQLHPVHGAYSSYDPYTNVSYAYQLSQGGTNWGPWTCKP